TPAVGARSPGQELAAQRNDRSGCRSGGEPRNAGRADAAAAAGRRNARPDEHQIEQRPGSVRDRAIDARGGGRRVWDSRQHGAVAASASSGAVRNALGPTMEREGNMTKPDLDQGWRAMREVELDDGAKRRVRAALEAKLAPPPRRLGAWVFAGALAAAIGGVV